MCKTPIDAVSNPGLYCFKAGMQQDVLYELRIVFPSVNEPGEKPYCWKHISEFQGAASETVFKKPDISPTLNSPNQPLPSQPPQAQPRPAPAIGQPVPTVVGVLSQPTQSVRPSQPTQTQTFVPFQRNSLRQVVQQMVGNPYLHQTMVHPWTAVVRTLKSWNGQGRAQRSEYWSGFYLYSIILSIMFVVLVFPLATLQYTSSGIVPNPLFLPAVAIMCVFLIPLLSLQIRRLHDIGVSDVGGFFWGVPEPTWGDDPLLHGPASQSTPQTSTADFDLRECQ